MSDNNFLKLEERIVAVLKTVYDPEIPVDVYNLCRLQGRRFGRYHDDTYRSELPYGRFYTRRYSAKSIGNRWCKVDGSTSRIRA